MKFKIHDRVRHFGSEGVIVGITGTSQYTVRIETPKPHLVSRVYESELTFVPADNDDDISRWEDEGGHAR